VSIKDHFFQFLTTAFAFFGTSSATENSHIVRLKKTLFNHLEEIQFFNDPRGVYAQCLVNLTW
jgi:hypothetical protein